MGIDEDLYACWTLQLGLAVSISKKRAFCVVELVECRLLKAEPRVRGTLSSMEDEWI